jgi:uncharacterized OsmC-like protein
MQTADRTAIATAVASLRAHFTEHPEQAVGRDSVARARLVEGLRVDVEGPNGWIVATDMSESMGGTASAPSPGWLLRAAIASCDAVLIAIQAAEEAVALTQIETEVTSESDDRGILGGTDLPPGPLRVMVHVRLTVDGEPADGDLDGLVARALRRSPVSEALGRVVPVDVSVEVGRPLGRPSR